MIQYDLELYVNIFGMGAMSMFMSDMGDALNIYFIDMTMNHGIWDPFSEKPRGWIRNVQGTVDWLDELSNFRSSQ
jgi:hypothetical protein